MIECADRLVSVLNKEPKEINISEYTDFTIRFIEKVCVYVKTK